MDLRTSEAYWLMKNGYDHSFHTLTRNLQTEVAVVGAGITGALASYALTGAGIETAVFDQRHPGMGSTAASTALLQYEIDEPLHSLIGIAGRKRAENSYLSCCQAIDTVTDLVAEEKIPCNFRRQSSLQYASFQKDTFGLRQELKARQKLGIAVDYLEPPEIEKRFGFQAPGALLSRKSAQVDAYALAQGLLSLRRNNLQVYDTTEIVRIEPGTRSVRLLTNRGCRITARKLVIACGYESQKFLPVPVATLGSTYAMVSKPVAKEQLWRDKALLWETKDPYLYLRTTRDNRLLFGGRDDRFSDPIRRNRALPGKAAKLMADVKKLFPELPLYPDFAWAGVFGSTKDSLAYVGSVSSLPNTYFILGFGGNGILFSQTGAEIIRDAILGRKNPWAETFSFQR